MNWFITILELFIPKDVYVRFFQYTSNNITNLYEIRTNTTTLSYIFFSIIFIIAAYYVFDIFIIFVKKMIGKKKRKH